MNRDRSTRAILTTGLSLTILVNTNTGSGALFSGTSIARALRRAVLAAVPALIVLFGAGCGDFGVEAYNTAPSVAITEGPEGAAFDEHETLTVRAVVVDNEDLPADLAVSVTVDGEGLDVPVPDPEGELSFQLAAGDHGVGEHSIVLRVVDTDGASGSAEDSFTVVLAEPPTAEIVAPGKEDSICAGEAVLLEGTASDPEGDAEALVASWSADVDGDLAVDQEVSSDGYTSAVARFPTAGDQLLTLTVTNARGADGVDSVLLSVLSAEQCNEPPEASIDSPADGDAFVSGDCITFAGTASDAEDDPADLQVTWSSSLDGLLHDGSPDAAGGTTFDGCDLTNGTHQIELAVTDALAGTGQATVAILVCPDEDGDGFGTCTGPDGAIDCDDGNPGIYPGAPEQCDGLDNDCDGVVPDDELDDDGDGFSDCEGDCDDGAAETHPGAAELCDGLDNDCDGVVPDDELDGDGDGYGVCEGDCDDGEGSIHPGASEVLCDGLDNDCDPSTDDSPDVDGDGDSTCDDCDDTDPTLNLDDIDGDLFSTCAGDCDDGDPAIHPGAPEQCDGLDNDCDGLVPADETDDDGDGFSDCEGDCDDGDPATYPGAAELCDGLDNDCDGLAGDDEHDADGDGFMVCDGDCDDGEATIHPGASELPCDGLDNDCDPATEDSPDGDGDGATTCDDCDDTDPALNLDDLDGDLFSTCAGDCNDGDAAIHPGATEVCNAVDDDCDGSLPATETDGDGDGYLACEECDDTDAALNPLDLDGDGFSTCDGDCNDGDAGLTPVDGDGDGWSTCDGDCDDGASDLNLTDLDGDGYSTCEDDCDDGHPGVYPGAPELCDDLDNDCDGAPGAGEQDGDADGYMACTGDCDDADPAVNPGEAEVICDGLDNDCDPATADEPDGDGDGWSACDDCEDGDAAIHPGAIEVVCTFVDEDCDPTTEDQPDDDGDGYTVCDDCDDDDPLLNLADADGDGWDTCDGDCDDVDADTNPGAGEPCDGIDNDCDGVADDPDILGCYDFGEGGGDIAYDASWRGNDGLIEGSVSYDAGYDGLGLHFEGGWVDLGNITDPSLSGALSIEAWVLVEASTWDHQVILTRWYEDNVHDKAFVFEFQPNGNRLQLAIDGTNCNDGYSTCDTTTTISFGTWVHVAAVYDGASMSLYLDGVEQGSFTVWGSMASSTAPLFVGAHDSVGDRNPFDGTIDELRIYGRALSDAEVVAHASEFNGL